MFDRGLLGWRLCVCLALLTSPLVAEDQKSPWGDFVEKDFPFFGTVLDARELKGQWAPETETNLVPRGIVLQLEHGVYACFDPDMLRLALVWQEDEEGNLLSMNGMAAGSYHEAGKKAPGGQARLPHPEGNPLVSSGLFPGCRIASEAPWIDPRQHAPDPDELGLGPLEADTYQFEGITLVKGVTLRYRVGQAEVSEMMSLSVEGDRVQLIRHLELDGNAKALQFHNGYAAGSDAALVETVAANTRNATLSIPLPGADPSRKTRTSSYDWTPEVKVSAEGVPAEGGPYVIEKIPAPLDNPWKRNVRLAGLDFFDDGRAALCTFDGDIWIASNIDADLQDVTWKRFGSGLQEPMSLQIVKGEIFVFDRGGIWKLLDKDNNGEADTYEMFCNLFAQTAETREFANDMCKKPDGRFVIAKAGQSDTTQGIHNGTIIEVAPDGKSFEVIAGGLRQPFIGYHPEQGIISSSDQQGHWVPSTPLHIIKKDAHYGFIPLKIDGIEQPKPITEPLCWIPHFVNQSGASQITNSDERFGPMAGKMLHLGFNRPELFCVYRDGDQGGVSPFLTGFDTGTLKMAVNPQDGQLYIAGFKIWGTVAEKVTGFYRVRYTGEGLLETPEMVRSSDRGVLIRFEFPVEETIATNLGSYNVDRWNYERSSNYGSGHFKLDGTPGQESISVSSVSISDDKRSIFLGIPDMKPSHQLRVTYRLPIPAELPQVRSTFLTVHHLQEIDLTHAGFASNEVDLTPREVVAGADQEPSIEIGQHLYVALGCMACHSIDGSMLEKVGPSWLGLYGSQREFTDGTVVKKADEVYLRESILNPSRKVTAGFAGEGVGMPSYLGILQDYQIDSIILYIKSLQKPKKK